jgi:hypothetical protein
MPTFKPMTRRELLAMAGLSAIVGGVSVASGAAGVLALRKKRARRTASHTSPSPTPADGTPRPQWVKHIDRPPIVARGDWGARPVDHTAANENGFYSLQNVEGWRDYKTDLRTVYKSGVVHHTAFYETDDLTTMREIQNQHMDLREWADIGYHFGVGRTGTIYEGRSLQARGTHTEHYNTGSVGVVFFGNFQVEEPTWEQFDAGRRLIDWLALRLELTHLAGHGDFNAGTDCPGRYMVIHLAELAQSAGLMLGTGGYDPPLEQRITPTPTPAP